MKSGLLFFLNPLNWFRAWRFQRQNAKFDKSTYDLELYLYSKILQNDMLHYGYFENVQVAPETISLKQLEDAQILYAQNIIAQVTDKENAVLDIGCGMGGLTSILLEKNYVVEALTPNANQFRHIQNKYPILTCHNKKLEDFTATKQYGTLINAESLQYIQLKEAFEKAGQLLLPGGKWIITDYFRTAENAANKSGHYLGAFLEKAPAYNWEIVVQKDITENILPTLKVINLYATRFLLPVKHFALEKFRYKKAWLYFLSEKLREAVSTKMDKELMSIDPERFRREKKYLMLVLRKKTG